MGLIQWIEDRTGVGQLARAALYEPIPGGARWRYVWGSTLVFGFVLQVVTGFCMWAAYSPSVQHAWASVFYIQHSMALGAWIRGVHHYTAQAMVVLMVLHFLQVILGGAYRAPREFNYWLGMVLLKIVLALALTGYLLPWDQKGYYATQVATKIIGATPWIGESLQQLVQGGTDYGQLTLTRFFALHAGILPTLFALALVVHIALFRRHGITSSANPDEPSCPFWPDQVLRDALACLAVLAAVLTLVWLRPTELHPPADPAEPFAAARPEWYFLSLFRFLKFESVEHLGLAFGAIYLPATVMVVVCLFPLTAKIPGGHRMNVTVTCLLLAGVLMLTALAWYEDSASPSHQAALRIAHVDGERAVELASRASRIPVEGAQALLQNDPLTRGPKLFAQHCAACHHFDGHNGLGGVTMEADPKSGDLRPALPTAADLGELGSRSWMRAVVTDFSNHFAPFKNAAWYGQEDALDPDDSEMADWSGEFGALVSKENQEDLNALVEFLVQQTGRADLAPDEDQATRGREIAVEGQWQLKDLEGVSCADCHSTIGDPFDPSGDGDGYPDIAQYLSHKWLTDFIANPDDEQHFGSRNRMPAYRGTLTTEELDLLVRWLTGEYYRSNPSESSD